jgi:hypothetical protein
MPKATTVRFTEEVYARLDQASSRTGLPVNSIVIAACLDWLQRHAPPAEMPLHAALSFEALRANPPVGPRWATISRAMKQAMGKRQAPGTYPFDRFTDHGKELLKRAQEEAEKSGDSYIGTEHMLLAAFGRREFQAARILEALGIEQAVVRASIAKAIGEHKPAPVGKIIPTSRVKRVLEIAFNLCGSMGDPCVGTNHMLLALAAEGEGIAGHVLADLGATKERILSEMAQLSEPEA